MRCEHFPLPVRDRIRGFSLLELVIAISIIAVLAGVAISRLWDVQVNAERAAMETVVGALQSALSMKVAELMLAGDRHGIEALSNSNPMDRLSERPKNYAGVLQGAGAANARAGQWYFDAAERVLVYHVYNAAYFRGGTDHPARVRFAIQVDVDAQRDGRNLNIAGARLVALDTYRWEHAR